MIPIGLKDSANVDIIQRIRRRLSLAKGGEDSRYLVAVSGGPDSLALLSILASELKIPAKQLVACYVDHGLRSTTDKDRAAIRRLTDKFDIEFAIVNVDTPGHIKQERQSIEAAARQLRYEALEKTAAEKNCDCILTGHTLDDSAETVLMRMLSGAPWYEWTAIPAIRGNIRRPLIDVFRSEVIDYLNSASIEFSQDETNFDSRFRRNALRKRLAESAFRTDDRMIEIAGAGEDLNRYLKGFRSIATDLTNYESKQAFTACSALAIKLILTYFTILPFLPVEAAWARLTGDKEARLPSTIRRQISDCVNGSSDRSLILLPDGFLMERRGETIWVYKDAKPKIEQRVGFGETLVDAAGYKLILEDRKTMDEVESAVFLDARIAKTPLTLRNWQAGDRLKIRGRRTKKISDLLAEEKLSPPERAQLLVLADATGPLVLLGKHIDERALPTQDCRNYLKVSWIPIHDE